MYLAQADPFSRLISDYGYVGIITACLLAAIITLWRREVRVHDEERQINANLRNEIKDLNDKIQTQALTALSETTKVVSEFLVIARRDR